MNQAYGFFRVLRLRHNLYGRTVFLYFKLQILQAVQFIIYQYGFERAYVIALMANSILVPIGLWS